MKPIKLERPDQKRKFIKSLKKFYVFNTILFVTGIAILYILTMGKTTLPIFLMTISLFSSHVIFIYAILRGLGVKEVDLIKGLKEFDFFLWFSIICILLIFVYMWLLFNTGTGLK